MPSWRGTLALRVVSRPALARAGLGLRERAVVAAMARGTRARVDAWSQPDMRLAGSRVRVDRFRVPLYERRETYAVGADERTVDVRADERLGPVGWPRERRYPALLAPDGAGATVPLLGSEWSARLSASGPRLEARLGCPWAEGIAVLNRTDEAVPWIDTAVPRTLQALERRLLSTAFALESAKDSRCVFAYAYAILTRQLGLEVDARADIDAAWVIRLAEVFAARYFDALAAPPATCEPAWQAAFDAMKRRTSVLEDLVMAMAVHIEHDLPIALQDVAPLPEHIGDFHAMNEILGNAITAIQRDVAKRYSPYIRWLDRLGGLHDEALTGYGIRLSRSVAWYNAARLADPRTAAAAREAIQRSAIVFVESLVDPPNWSVRQVLRLFRLIVAFGRRWPIAEPLV